MLNIKQLMWDKGLNQTKLAEIMGVNQSAVSKFLRGTRLPMSHHILKLNKFFGEEVLSQYIIPDENFKPQGKEATVTILTPEVVEDIKEEVREEIEAEEMPRREDAQLYGAKRGDDIINAVMEEIATLRREILSEREKKDSQIDKMLEMMQVQVEQQSKLIDYITKENRTNN